MPRNDQKVELFAKSQYPGMYRISSLITIFSEYIILKTSEPEKMLWRGSGSVTSCAMTQIWQRHFLVSPLPDLCPLFPLSPFRHSVNRYCKFRSDCFGFFCYGAVSSHCRSPHIFFSMFSATILLLPQRSKELWKNQVCSFEMKLGVFHFGFGMCSTHTGTLHFGYRDKGLLQRQLRHKMAERAMCTHFHKSP